MAPRSRSRKAAIIVMSVGLFALAAAGALGALGGKGQVETGTTTTTSAPTTTLPPVSNLGAVGARLGQLVEDGRKVDYAAVYTVTDPALPAGLVQTVEMWRKGEDFRQDIVERTGGSTTRHTSITGHQPRKCDTVNGTQTCQLVRSDEIGIDLPGAFVRRVVLAPRPPKLTMKKEVVADYEGTCFEASGEGMGKPDKKGNLTKGSGELCLNGDGTLLRLVLQGATIELSSITSSVPSSAFETTKAVTTTTRAK
jgi:hypothetical protein